MSVRRIFWVPARLVAANWRWAAVRPGGSWSEKTTICAVESGHIRAAASGIASASVDANSPLDRKRIVMVRLLTYHNLPQGRRSVEAPAWSSILPPPSPDASRPDT